MPTNCLPVPQLEQSAAALEDAEDIAVVREALAVLNAAGGDRAKAGFRPWAEVRAELSADAGAAHFATFRC